MNFNERLLQGYDIGKKISKFHGQTRLDLLRDGKVVHRVEKSNTITGWIGDALSAGNFFNQISANKIYPLSQWFDGCFLTHGTNDPSTSMLAGNADVVAQAGNDSYSGLYTKRGSYNSYESGSGVDEYGKCFVRNVWDWTTSQGNGIIDSVCLTRGDLGKVAIDSSTVYDDCGEAFENVVSSGSVLSINPDLQSLNILDYENEKGFSVAYESGTITIDEYYINTKRIHLLGGNLDVIEKTGTHVITQTMSKYYTLRRSLSYDGDYIYLFTWNSGGNVLDECAIKISDWSSTFTSHTYGGLSLIPELNAYDWVRDAFPMVEESGTRYLYVFTSDAKCMKLNLSSSAITEITIPVSIDKWFASCPTCFFANGDWIKMNITSYKKALYWHNGSFYTTKTIPSSDTNYKYLTASGYGTAIHGHRNLGLQMLFPFVNVSTVNNITQVEKQASLTMKLTYTITET